MDTLSNVLVVRNFELCKVNVIKGSNVTATVRVQSLWTDLDSQPIVTRNTMERLMEQP